jgi:hypothetical protein
LKTAVNRDIFRDTGKIHESDVLLIASVRNFEKKLAFYFWNLALIESCPGTELLRFNILFLIFSTNVGTKNVNCSLEVRFDDWVGQKSFINEDPTEAKYSLNAAATSFPSLTSELCRCKVIGFLVMVLFY